MRSQILTLSLFLLVTIRSVFPQAAAESVLLNGNSATAATKASTALGNGLNKSSKKVAGQVQTISPLKGPSKRATLSSTHSSAPAHTANERSSMIISIQGGRVTHSSASSTQSPAH